MLSVEQKALIDGGEVVGSQEQFTAFQRLPLVFRGFQGLSLMMVEIKSESLKTLVPDHGVDPKFYQPEQAIVILEKEKPVLAIIKGVRLHWQKQVSMPDQISLVNLNDQPEKVILRGNKTQTLTNNYYYCWPGYLFYNHYEQLSAKQEKLAVVSQGNGSFELFFECFTPAYGV